MKQLTMIGNNALTFGEALELLKQGKIVQRTGWNGKGMFIFRIPLVEYPVKDVLENLDTFPEAVKQYYKNIAESTSEVITISFVPYLCMKAADETIVNGWLASQTDILAKDWVEVGYVNEED